jgi:hypothetical protein
MKRRGIFLVGMALAAGAMAFLVGRAAAVRPKVPGWLEDVPAETVQAEQDFQDQTRRLTQALRDEQAALISMLPDGRFTGEQILAQVDTVTQSYARLAESVGAHLVRLDGVLPRVQGRRLMQCCANSIRGSMQRRYRWRGGFQQTEGGFMGSRRGGPGRGAGRRAGYGRQFRGGWSDDSGGLARRLQLTDEQNAWIRRQDPNVEEQCAALRDRLYEVHEDLVASLGNAQTSGEELMTKVEDLIEAYSALEKRVARHVVLLRPQLSQQQRQHLSDLCRGGFGTDDNSRNSTGGNPIDNVTARLLATETLASLL